MRYERTSKQDVLKELRRRGVAQAVVNFSGGNDQGGIDSIDLYDAAGEKLDAPEEMYDSEYDPEQKRYVERPLTPEQKAGNELINGLGEPVYARYGSFAGEFSVWGKVTWDVATGQVTMSGDVETPRSDSFNEVW